MEKINLDNKALRKFGIVMGIAFLVISGIFFFRHKPAGVSYSLTVSTAFFIIALAMPLLLKPVYRAWMRLALILGWINTRIILVILFYFVFTPVGLAMRLFKIDLLERKKNEKTYWKNKEKVVFDPINYERRF